MSTAWYMVDADGNVGLMAFDDNGPVPEFNHVQPDLGLSDLVFGQGFSEEGTCKGIHLNAAQIHELLGQPRAPKDVELWYQVCLAISPEYTTDFLTLCKNEDITNYGCISSEMNLFFVDVFECFDDNYKIIVDSTFDKMIKANMVKAIYQVPELDVNAEYNQDTESTEFTKNFVNTPYYIYCQPYWTSDPQHRMNIPSNPVKITQIDEQYRERLLHVPVRFKDMEDIQLAQWFVCDTNAKDLIIDDAGYSLLPIDEHKHKYCLTRPFLFDFYGYCPERGHYNCEKCNHECASTVTVIRSLTPTILYVIAPERNYSAFNSFDLPQKINEKVAVFSYIPKFPYQKQRVWMDIDLVKERMTVQVLVNLLFSSRGWFEEVVRTINPQVIIIDDEALQVFTSVFPVTDNKMRINNSLYPIFAISSVKKDSSPILALAKLPYRGKVFPMTYSEQEVEALKRQNKVSEFE